MPDEMRQPLSLQDAIDELYRVAFVEKKSQSPSRLRRLADFCIQELDARGMPGASAEVTIAGVGRRKQWDVAWAYDGKVRLAISLKSLLRNLPGTVPNRIDDLMGEVSNLQLSSPEIVIGYVMIFDVGADVHAPKHGSTWSAFLRSRLELLSGRRPPSWAVGTIEAFAFAEVDFSNGPTVLAGTEKFRVFFDTLAEQVFLRNPNARP